MTDIPDDSRLIYKAASHLGSQVTWDDEWVHFGTGQEIKYELIEHLIDNFLTGEEVVFVNERANSRHVKKRESVEVIKPLLGNENFELWNKSMKQVISFNRIGVLQQGRKLE